jgi:hypothetical protein
VQIEVTSRDMLYMRSLVAGNSYSQGMEIPGPPASRGVYAGGRGDHILYSARPESKSLTHDRGRAGYAFTAGLP